MKKKAASYTYVREAFHIKRFHTVPHTAMPESVGHHTANLIAMIFFIFDDDPPIELVRYALHHDVPELGTGDIPAPAKWQYHELGQVLETVEKGIRERQGLSECPTQYEGVFKFVDMIDLCFKAVEEMSAGNLSYEIILGRGLAYITQLLEGPLRGHVKAHEVYEILKSNRFINIMEIQIDFNPEGSTKH